MLNEASSELVEALEQETGLMVSTYHTGGGVMVTAVDLTIDGRGLGRQAWLTRDEGWLLGFYDFHSDPEDEGIVVSLMPRDPESALSVASTVAGLLARVGATLQGEGRIAVEFPTGI